MKKILFFIILAVIINPITSNQLIAQYSNLGTSGAQFLQIPISAKNASLGNAIIATCSDAASVYWNPSGILGVNSHSVHFTYMEWFKFFNINAISYVYNAGDFGNFGISLLSLTMDKMEITTEFSPNGTGRYFDAQDLAIGISYARKLSNQFRIGLTSKYIYQRIWNETASGVAFDIGTQYQIEFKNITIAMTMSNFGPDLKLEGPELNVVYDKNSSIPLNRLTYATLSTDPYPLPLHFQVGLGMDVYHSELLKVRGEVNVSHPNDNKERVLTGLEFAFFDRVFLRGGYKHNFSDENFSLGTGVTIPYSSTHIKFDYAYIIHKILPDVHIISLGIEF